MSIDTFEPSIKIEGITGTPTGRPRTLKISPSADLINNLDGSFTLDLSSYITTASASTTYLKLDGSNSDDTTDGFDWFKNLVIGAGNAGKGQFIYRNTDYIYTLINAAPTATTYSTVDYQIVANGYLDLQSYDSGATNDLRLFRFKEIADGVDGNYLRIRRHTTNVHTGGELDLYLDQYGVSYITTTVVGDYGGQLNLWAGGNKGMEIGNYIAGYLGYNLKILQYGGTDVALLGATSGNENVSIGGYLTATGNTKHFYFNLSDTDDTIHLTREDANILGFSIDMPVKATSVSSVYKASDGTAAVADGTYTVGLKLTGGGNNGTITIKDGVITAIQQAT